MNERRGGLTTREIAAILGISHATVEKIEKQAIAKMAAIAKEEKMMIAEMMGTLSDEAYDAYR